MIEEKIALLRESLQDKSINNLLHARREAINLVKETEFYLNEILDDFDGTVQEAINLGLVKANFPQRKR